MHIMDQEQLQQQHPQAQKTHRDLQHHHHHRRSPSNHSLSSSSASTRSTSSTSIAPLTPPDPNQNSNRGDDGNQQPIVTDSVHLADQASSSPYNSSLVTDEPLPSAKLSKLDPSVSFDPPIDPNCRLSNPLGLDHAEFGDDGFDSSYRWISQFRLPSNLGLLKEQQPIEAQATDIHPTNDPIQIPLDSIQFEQPEEPAYWVYLSTYLSYLILIVLGHIRDFFGKRFKSEAFRHLMPRDGYAALNSDFDSFYTRRLKARMDDCFSRPVTGVAGRTIKLIDRTTQDHCRSFQFTSSISQALNISSYNYLGFAQSKGYVTDSVQRTLEELSVSVGGTREEVGSFAIQIRCEKLIASFLGVEDAMLISQGFATNSTTFPAMASKGTLIISDELNHSSIRFGSRLSNALVRQYKHNDMADLERLLRESISQGQPRTHRPWKKIIVVVEGIYSMEGTIVNLPALYSLKSIYKFYLYVDEAHSIGALGPRGRGVSDYYGLDPNHIDVLMGTLTKSFGASGGYIAGKKALISQLRLTNHSSVYAESMSPPVVQQIISSLKMISGDVAREKERDLKSGISEGKERLGRLAFNARYLSSGLRKLGFIVYGDRDSPIIPLLIFHPGKMLQFSRMMLEQFSIVVVVVAYPATPLVSSRVRFCVSASHTKEDIDKILIATDQIGEILGLKISKRNGFSNDPNQRSERRWTIDEVLGNSLELVES